ncbi:MAG TPA: hypothetical protein DGF10_02355 [Acidimicrobiaceae bacterium]|nr:hypothetical protein [Acidimicrobiaceae bacterium]HAQ23723.1 hypothetical protein [Acidimicrobiaceae bacterium]HCV33483.1 hypothetical protein [Acidimicrobiaceae bacterium]
MLKPGARFTSNTCDGEVIIVKGVGEADLRCGGVPMSPAGGETVTGELSPEASGGTQMGKRYADTEDSIEILCTKPGEGSLGLGNALLDLKEAKPLPASD